MGYINCMAEYIPLAQRAMQSVSLLHHHHSLYFLLHTMGLAASVSQIHPS